MITFDEYISFSDTGDEGKKKPGKIKQFFKKHGKKIALGAGAVGLLGLGTLGYMNRDKLGAGFNKGKDMVKNLFKGKNKEEAQTQEPPKTAPTVTTTAAQNNKKTKTNVTEAPKKPTVERGAGNTRFIVDGNGNKIPVTNNIANGMTDDQVVKAHQYITARKDKEQRLQARANTQSRNAVLAKADKLFKNDSKAKERYISRALDREIRKNSKKKYL